MKKTVHSRINNIDGIEMSSIYSGMYKKKRLDLSVMRIDGKSSVAGVFTKNKVKSAAVSFSQRNLTNSKPKYLIVNAGNANAGTGKIGYQDMIKYCKVLADLTSCSINEILVCSTGVIGERINSDKICKTIPKLLSNLKSSNWVNFSKSILTTDKKNKILSNKFLLKGKIISITGVAKGSGMIMPDMATMLSFVATDLIINKKTLNALLKKITDISYNMINDDSDTSTNDSSILIATGKSKINYNSLSLKERKLFFDNLKIIYQGLAKKIIEDGEGATKLIQIDVKNAKTTTDAKKIAMAIANSPLVKTAIFAEDPNWGRILAAIGKADTTNKLLPEIKIQLGKILVFQNNKLSPKYNESAAKKYLKNKNINIIVNYNSGTKGATVWTSDLSYEYIKINANYRT